MNNGYQPKEPEKSCYNCIHQKGCTYLQFTLIESSYNACAYWEPTTPTSSTNIVNNELNHKIKVLKEELKKYRHSMCMISETCVNESKCYISAEEAIKKIRQNIYYSSLINELED